MTIEEAYQGRSHNVYITNQYYDQPKTTSVGERRQYMVDTDNNMVRPGNETGRFFSPFPDFFQSKLDILDGGIVRDRNRAMKTISIRESYGQGYLKEDDKYLHWYIQNELEGNDLIIPFVKFADISK